MCKAILITFFVTLSYAAYGQSNYLVKVDKLRVRNAPGLSSQTIFMLEEGSIVESTGAISDLKDEVELRGIIYKAPYYQIKFADNRKGWVYGAATQQVSETRLSNKSKSILTQFHNYLVELGHKSLENGALAYAYYYDNVSELKNNEATAAAIILENYLIALAEGLYDLLSDLPYPEIPLEDFLNSDELIFQKLRNNGMKPVAMEGSFYPEIDYQIFKKKIESNTTIAYQGYLARIISDKQVTLESDGGIIIPIEDVAIRGMEWKKFNEKYPDFPLHEKSDAIEKHLKILVLTGMDNTPAFNWDGKVESNFMNSWQKIILRYPNSEFTDDLKEYIRLIKENNGKKSPSLNNILQKYYTDYMLFY